MSEYDYMTGRKDGLVMASEAIRECEDIPKALAIIEQLIHRFEAKDKEQIRKALKSRL